MLFDNITKNLKVKLSFGHKAVILSLSKLDKKVAELGILFENVT